MSNFAIFLLGTAFVTLGLAFTAHKLGATPIWIGIGSTIIIGLGIMIAVSKTRTKEKSANDK